MGFFKKQSGSDGKISESPDVIDSLVDQLTASGDSSLMYRLWDTVMRLESWHFMSQPFSPELPVSGPGSPRPIFGRLPELQDKLLLFAFTDDQRAFRAMKHNGFVSLDGGYATITMSLDNAAKYAHEQQQNDVWGILFNQCEGRQGFFAPLTNIAPMYECAHGVVIPGIESTRPTPDFDSLARAFKQCQPRSPQSDYRLTAYIRCLLNLKNWHFLSDPEKPGFPMMWAIKEEIVLLGFTDPHRAAHTAQQMNILDENGAADVISKSLPDSQSMFDAFREHGVQRVVFNITTEPLPLRSEGLLAAKSGL